MGRVKELIFESGERYPILVQKDDLPAFFPTLYATIKMRPTLQPASMKARLYDIQHLSLWEEMQVDQVSGESRDIMREFASGRLLDESDIESLVEHCGIAHKPMREWHELSSKKKVSTLGSVGLLPTVKKKQKADRLRTIAAYLKFSAEALLRKKKNYSSNLKSKIKDMENAILKEVPKGSSKKRNNMDLDAVAPPPEVFEELVAISRENSSRNPFKNAAARKRNALMIDTLDTAGIRVGELLGIYVQDINVPENKILIRRRPDDKHDKRKRKADAKTLERNIPISPELTAKLVNYIKTSRKEARFSKQHPFLFVTHKSGPHFGKPLSYSAFALVIKQLIGKDSEYLSEIKSHGFRHNDNYRFSELIAINNKLAAAGIEGYSHINADKEKEIRMRRYGWSSDGTAKIYNERHYEKEADKLQKLQQDIACKRINLKEILSEL